MSVAVNRPIALVGVILAAGAAALVVVGGTGASAQAPGTQTLTIKELDKGSTFAYVDAPPKSRAKGEPRATPGDVIVFSNPLATAAGASAGKLRVRCVITTGAPRVSNAGALCEGAFSLPGGMLSVAGYVVSLAKTVTISVTGGTGAYAGARGTLVSTPAKSGADDVITLLGS